jgi:hypothetical protein
VEDYHKKIKITMIQANIVQNRKVTITRFLKGQDMDIADVVELQHYMGLEDMVHVTPRHHDDL